MVRAVGREPVAVPQLLLKDNSIILKDRTIIRSLPDTEMCECCGGDDPGPPDGSLCSNSQEDCSYLASSYQFNVGGIVWEGGEFCNNNPTAESGEYSYCLFHTPNGTIGCHWCTNLDATDSCSPCQGLIFSHDEAAGVAYCGSLQCGYELIQKDGHDPYFAWVYTAWVTLTFNNVSALGGGPEAGYYDLFFLFHKELTAVGESPVGEYERIHLAGNWPFTSNCALGSLTTLTLNVSEADCGPAPLGCWKLPKPCATLSGGQSLCVPGSNICPPDPFPYIRCDGVTEKTIFSYGGCCMTVDPTSDEVDTIPLGSVDLVQPPQPQFPVCFGTLPLNPCCLLPPPCDFTHCADVCNDFYTVLISGVGFIPQSNFCPLVKGQDCCHVENAIVAVDKQPGCTWISGFNDDNREEIEFGVTISCEDVNGESVWTAVVVWENLANNNPQPCETQCAFVAMVFVLPNNPEGGWPCPLGQYTFVSSSGFYAQCYDLTGVSLAVVG